MMHVLSPKNSADVTVPISCFSWFLKEGDDGLAFFPAKGTSTSHLPCTISNNVGSGGGGVDSTGGVVAGLSSFLQEKNKARDKNVAKYQKLNWFLIELRV
jgi:hypothetical protein